MRPDFLDDEGREYRKWIKAREECLRQIHALEVMKNLTYVQEKMLLCLRETILPSIHEKIATAEMAMADS
jgi:hypothetical protein